MAMEQSCPAPSRSYQGSTNGFSTLGCLLCSDYNVFRRGLMWYTWLLTCKIGWSQTLARSEGFGGRWRVPAAGELRDTLFQLRLCSRAMSSEEVASIFEFNLHRSFTGVQDKVLKKWLGSDLRLRSNGLANMNNQPSTEIGNFVGPADRL